MATPPRKRVKLSEELNDSDERKGGAQGQLEQARDAARQSLQRAQVRRQDGGGRGDDDLDSKKVKPSPSRASHSPSPSRTSAPPPKVPPTRALPPYTSHPTITQSSAIHAYKRLNHIEEGTYGVVYRAQHISTGEIVAIKRLKMDRERNGFPITSLREIRTLLMAQGHENIVAIREVIVGDTLTQIYIAFEFVEHDLRSLLTQLEKPFTLSEIKSLVQQLLKAVGLLHSQWIIHRDIKTSNLLINNRGTLKLADFGLARLYGEGGQDEKMTELVVTLWYRAPELLLGVKEYDIAVDMWSVGCVMAELLLQEPLFAGKNESEQVQLIFKTLGQPPSTLFKSTPTSTTHQPYSILRKKFPPSLSNTAAMDLLHKLLTYDPTKRITAQEALQHDWFTTESPKPAHPDSFGSFPSVAAGERRRRREGSIDAKSGRKEDGKRYALTWDWDS